MPLFSEVKRAFSLNISIMAKISEVKREFSRLYLLWRAIYAKYPDFSR